MKQFILLIAILFLLTSCGFDGEGQFLGEVEIIDKPQMDARAALNNQILVYCGETNAEIKFDNDSIIPGFINDCKVQLEWPDGNVEELQTQIIPGTGGPSNQGFVYYSSQEQIQEGAYSITANFPNGATTSASFDVPTAVSINPILVDSNIVKKDEFNSVLYDFYRVIISVDDITKWDDILAFQVYTGEYKAYIGSDDRKFIGSNFDFESRKFYIESNTLYVSTEDFETPAIELSFYIRSDLRQNENQLVINQMSTQHRLHTLAKENQGFSGDLFSGEPLNIPTNVEGGLGFCYGYSISDTLLP